MSGPTVPGPSATGTVGTGNAAPEPSGADATAPEPSTSDTPAPEPAAPETADRDAPGSDTVVAGNAAPAGGQQHEDQKRGDQGRSHDKGTDANRPRFNPLDPEPATCLNPRTTPLTGP